MSEYTHKENSGALFKQEPEEKKSETSPDFKGSTMVGGVEYWLSGWAKTSDNGTNFISLAFTSKDEAAARKATGWS